MPNELKFHVVSCPLSQRMAQIRVHRLFTRERCSIHVAGVDGVVAFDLGETAQRGEHLRVVAAGEVGAAHRACKQRVAGKHRVADQQRHAAEQAARWGLAALDNMEEVAKHENK